jgi:hypothetical protein
VLPVLRSVKPPEGALASQLAALSVEGLAWRLAALLVLRSAAAQVLCLAVQLAFHSAEQPAFR